MRRFSQVCSLVAIVAASNAFAHTSSVGYESAGPGSVTFWYGTYHGGTNFTEGSLSLVGQDVTFSSTVPFTTVTQSKPAGLIDGTTNFYSNGSALVGTPTTSIVAWQGATFSSLVAGTYAFTYIPISHPTSTWAPIDSVILSSNVTLSSSIVNPGPTIIDSSQPSFDENDPAATGATIEFDGGTLAPTTDINLAQPIISDAGGAFIDTTSGDVVASGDISGVGALIKEGTGTLRLTGSSSYAGGTTVAVGTLIGDTDSLQGPITNNGVLEFDQLTNGTYGGVVSGGGAFVKEGVGTLRLTGANSYSGGTTVAAGALIGDTNSLQGPIVNNGIVEFDQTTDGTYAGAISGSGAFTKNGTGVLHLTGANGYTGGTTIAAGTLVGDALSLQGPIVNNAILQFDQATNGTYAGTISGNGAFVKDGAGALRLTGPNSYAGGTTITAGTLIGNSSSLQGIIINNGALIFDQAIAGTYSGVISGSGAFTKEGAGALRLTGANSYTGGTTVAAGTLIGDTTSLQGSITNSGILTFDQPTDGDYVGAVSGSGSFVKDGAGMLRLTGTNSYRGGTTVAAGTLIGNTDSLQGPITNNAIVAFDQASDATFTGSIAGAGSIVKQGTGTLRLDSISSYSGPTDVQAGRLSVNGSIANSQVQVEAGASIGGNGTIGGLIVHTNATAAPGNSIGKLTAATTILFEPASFYSVEVDATGNNDRVAANGTATLQGGTVQVLAEAGTYAPATRYTILTADGGVDGQFADVTSNLAFLTPSLSYTSNAVSLLLVRNDLSFASAGHTPNQSATGAAADLSFAIGSPVYDALVETSAVEARRAFDVLSGELHASLLSAAAQDADILRRTLISRLDGARSVDGRRVGLWASGFGDWGRLDDDGNASGVRRDSRGFLIGAETALNDRFLIGVAGGYSESDINVRRLTSHADISSTHGGAYMGYTAGPFAARIGGSYAHLSIDTRRAPAFGSFAETLTSHYKGSLIQAFGEAGYKLALGSGSVEPFVGVNAMWLRNKAFAETGGTAALEGAGQTRGRSWWTVGLKATIGDESDPLVVHGRLAWQHALSTRRVNSRLTFAASGESFDVRGAPLARDAALADAGLTWRVTANVSLGMNYIGTIANQSDDHSARATISVLF
jgi:outer membrane autotransporter protein